MESHTGFTALHHVIVAVKLSKCFLQQYRPQLFILSIAKSWCVTISHRNKIIDIYRGLFTSDAKVDFVNSGLVYLLGAEEGTNAIGVFSDSAHGAEEVTVSQLALVHITGLDSFLEYCRILEDLTGSLPAQVFVIALQTERILLWWKVGVCERFASFYDFFDEIGRFLAFIFHFSLDILDLNFFVFLVDLFIGE